MCFCFLGRDGMSIERGNMLSILKLVVKQLIDISLSKGGMLDDFPGPLLQFFTVIESILCHAMKSTSNILKIICFCHFLNLFFFVEVLLLYSIPAYIIFTQSAMGL